MSTATRPERSKKQKKIDAGVLERVKRGMAWLEEKHGPDWVDHIDMKTLDLESGAACVLGQVYAAEALAEDPEYGEGYQYALDSFFYPEGLDDADYGFCTKEDEEHLPARSWEMLQKAWKHVLTPVVKKR